MLIRTRGIMTTIKKSEKELAELKDTLEAVKTKVKETGGPKGQVWLFYTNDRIRSLEKRIEDIKTGKIRIDEVPSEAPEIEERIAKMEKSLKINIKAGK